MNRKQFNCEGVCPCCGSGLIEDFDTDFFYPQMSFTYKCQECGAEFVEVYDVVYNHTEVE